MLQITNIEGTNFGTASNVYDIYDIQHNKNIFELVVDNLVLDKYSDDDELKGYIRSLSKKNKRIGILSVLGDDNVLWKQISDLLENDISSYERLRGVYNLLKDYVKIADVERKKHGEILTPFKELAEPMIQLVEKYDKEFWKNKNHKILDSSAGYGTFLILAAYKFMVGLKDEFPDEEERFKWVVENCLYYGELQAKSVFSWLVAIDPHDEYETNIYWGDFLSEDFDKHAKDVWGVEKWDLIIQNPPYQMRKEGYKKTQPIWHLFVQKSLTLLKEGAYMVMVHPGGWRNVDGVFKNTQRLLRSKQIPFLKLHSFGQGQEVFDAAINFDYYCLINVDNNTQTEIVDVVGVREFFDISKLEFISDENNKEIQSLVAKEGEDSVEILSGSSYHTQKTSLISKVSDSIFKYKCIYTVKSPAKGNIPTFYYSNVNNKGFFNIPKVVWANGASGVMIDKNGDYGLTQFAYGIVDDVKNLENIKKALQTEKFIRNIMGFKKSLGDKYNRKIIGTFRKDFWKEFI